MEPEALTVLEGVVDGDEACVEGWYLGGWGLWLLAEKTGDDSLAKETITSPTSTTTKENPRPRIAYLKSSRRWLLSCLGMYQQTEYEDERLRDHARELVAAIEREFEEGGVVGFEDEDEDEEGDGWEGVESGEEEEGDGGGKEEDHVMGGA